MTVDPVAFYAIATLVVVAALAVVTLPDLLHAGAALAACLFLVGVLYLAVGADLLAGAEIVLGATTVPAILVVAAQRTRGGSRSGRAALVRGWPLAGLLSLLLGGLLGGILAGARDLWHTAEYPRALVDGGTTAPIGRALLGDHALAFEGAALCLLVALVGAVTLARRDEREAAMERAAEARRLREERARRRQQDRERARQRGATAADEAPRP